MTSLYTSFFTLAPWFSVAVTGSPNGIPATTTEGEAKRLAGLHEIWKNDRGPKGHSLMRNSRSRLAIAIALGAAISLVDAALAQDNSFARRNPIVEAIAIDVTGPTYREPAFVSDIDSEQRDSLGRDHRTQINVGHQTSVFENFHVQRSIAILTIATHVEDK